MTTRIRTTIASVAALGALAACSSNEGQTNPEGTTPGGTEGALTVSATEDSCALSANSATSGPVTFSISNDGSKVTEFYLLADDGLRIVAERENIAPATSADLSVVLQPGTYYTACKPGMRGANIGQAEFTVDGEAIELSGEDQELYDEAVTEYVAFVKNEVAELVPMVEEFAKAYQDGDDDRARELYPTTRIHYERIEPIAEALGTLDPRIDYREIDYLAEADLLKEDDPTFDQWLGFHRIEKDLWVPDEDAVQPDGAPALEGWEPSTDEQREFLAQTLIDDVNKLYDEVHSDDFVEANDLTIATISNGASSLLEEIATGKVTGEENWWSHKDLWDFQGNLEGSRIAFDLVSPIAERKGDDGKDLVQQINSEFDALQSLLDQYGNADDGYVSYDEVSSDQQRELTAQIDATREPLSRLTSVVLGIS